MLHIAKWIIQESEGHETKNSVVSSPTVKPKPNRIDFQNPAKNERKSNKKSRILHSLTSLMVRIQKKDTFEKFFQIIAHW